jgi:hypothetical protein
MVLNAKVELANGERDLSAEQWLGEWRGEENTSEWGSCVFKNRHF